MAAGTERVKKIDRAIALDREIKKQTKELEGIKAELQAEALGEIENKNIKYVQYFGSGGSAVVCYKDKFEVDNYALLKELLGDIMEDKSKREISVKITLDAKLKRAVTALYRDEAVPHDIMEILSWLGIPEKARKTAAKKLKGDYAKDLQTLESFGVDTSSGLEEELDAIREQLNYEVAVKFVPKPEALDRSRLRRAVSIEESLSIGLNYDGEDERNAAGD